MSWVQCKEKNWPTTTNEAELHLQLWPANAACPRRAWSWNLGHYVYSQKSDGKREMKRYLTVELVNLNFHDPDWRRLSGLEIRADSQWHELHESTNEHGHHDVSEALLYVTLLGRDGGDAKPEVKRGHYDYIAHDFI